MIMNWERKIYAEDLGRLIFKSKPNRSYTMGR